VRLGCVVKVQTKKETFKVRVVHPVEAHLDDERISSESPLGQAIMGNKKGDQVTVIAPSGNWSAQIKSVELLP
jgi:transcription elongation factor GreA